LILASIRLIKILVALESWVPQLNAFLIYYKESSEGKEQRERRERREREEGSPRMTEPDKRKNEYLQIMVRG
jgi:hypothetical protein